MLSEKKDYFITIAEIGNISKAAEVLYVSQPSLSQYVTKLEKKLGVKLIERNYTPLRLTESGKLYLEYAKKSEELEAQFRKKLAVLINQKNKITIGIPLQITNKIFPIIIEHFIPHSIDSQISIKGGTSLTLLDNFMNYDLDIAFVHTRDLNIPGIQFKVIAQEKLYLVCNGENELAKKCKSDPLHPIDLRSEEIKLFEKQRFVMLSKEYMLYKVCKEYFDTLGIFLDNTIELSDLDSILNYIIEYGNDVVALVPEYACVDLKERDKLAFLRINKMDFMWYFVLCRNKEKELPEVCQQFWNSAHNIQWP